MKATLNKSNHCLKCDAKTTGRSLDDIGTALLSEVLKTNTTISDLNLESEFINWQHQ